MAKKQKHPIEYWPVYLWAEAEDPLRAVVVAARAFFNNGEYHIACGDEQRAKRFHRYVKDAIERMREHLKEIS